MLLSLTNQVFVYIDILTVYKLTGEWGRLPDNDLIIGIILTVGSCIYLLLWSVSLSTMREIVHLQIGQCGNQISSKVCDSKTVILISPTFSHTSII